MSVNLMLGDCLERMKEIPDGSVDMVLCDPPYGTVKGMGAGEERYSKLANSDWDVALKPSDFLFECNRILRVNGCMALFSQEPYTSRLITEAHPNIPFSYRLIWLKDHFANSLLVNKAPVSYFEDIVIHFKKYDMLALHPLREYSETLLTFCGGDKKKINSALGSRKAEHFFYVDSTQFGICTEATYNQLNDIFSFSEEVWYKTYKELVEVDKQFKGPISKVFNLAGSAKYKSNVLQYKKDYTGLHPTQKPVKLMEDLILTYTNEGQTVLDFTMGSGTTGIACKNLNRNFIGIEMDESYFNIAKERIENSNV